MNNQSEKPIEELLRGVPQDHRICIPFQWAEDGRETGHHYIPVGRHAHQAAAEIAALRQQLAEKEDTETPHYTNCFGSGPKHYVCALMEITDLRERLKAETQLLLDGNKIASKCHREEVATLREALSRLIEVHDAMGGMCSPERILAEAALLGKAHKEKNGG